MTQSHIHKQFSTDLQILNDQLSDLSHSVYQQVCDSLNGVQTDDLKLLETVRQKEKTIDKKQHMINDDTVRVIALRQPVGIDLRYLLMVRDAANELERLGDYANNIAKWYKKASDSGGISGFSDLKHIIHYVCNMVAQYNELYEGDMEDNIRAERAIALIKSDDELDNMYVSLFRESLTYTLEDTKKITAFTHYMLIIKHIERMGDLVTNLSEMLYYYYMGVYPDIE